MFIVKPSLSEKDEAKEMFFSRSIMFDNEDPVDVAAATEVSSVYLNVETKFIDKLKAGDAESFDILITKYSADVYALLYRLTENAEEAGDLTQETFLSVLGAVRGFRGDSGLKTC